MEASENGVRIEAGPAEESRTTPMERFGQRKPSWMTRTNSGDDR